MAASFRGRGPWGWYRGRHPRRPGRPQEPPDRPRVWRGLYGPPVTASADRGDRQDAGASRPIGVLPLPRSGGLNELVGYGPVTFPDAVAVGPRHGANCFEQLVSLGNHRVNAITNELDGM